MKKIFIALISGIVLTTSAFSGELVNRTTKEKLIFSADYNSHRLRIDSTDDRFISRTLTLSSFSQRKSKINLYAATEETCLSIYDLEFDLDCILTMMIFPPIAPLTAAVDAIMLPFKLSAKIYQNSKFKKDYQKLQRAIANDELIEVSDKRFSRIIQILKAAI